MRLDVFLKLSRLIPRRSLAQEFCNSGLIRVNGAAAKSAKELKEGDEISIDRSGRRKVVRVRMIPNTKQVSKQTVSELYQAISDEKVESS